MSSSSNVDIHNNKNLYASSVTNPQTFSLPHTVTEFNNQLPTIKARMVVGTQTLVAVTNTAPNQNDILYFEYEESSDPLLSKVNSIISSSGGYPQNGDCSISHTVLAQREYMYTNKDYKNVEYTCWFESIHDNDPDATIEIKARGGHFYENVAHCCSGSFYGVRIYLAESGSNRAKVSVFKEQYAGSKIEKNAVIVSQVNSFFDRLFGVKFVVKNIMKQQRKTVVISVYMCFDSTKRNQEWVKISETEDYTGANWSNGQLTCNALSADAPITWGGYFTSCVFPNKLGLHFKWLTVREINPDISLGDPDPVLGSGQQTTTVNTLATTTTLADPTINPLMVNSNVILWDSNTNGKWNNGISRTITSNGEYDPYSGDSLFVSAGENKMGRFLGNGTAELGGARVRFYILAKNYNSSIEVTYIHNGTLDNLSLRLRSRHNENDDTAGQDGSDSRFGGYGAAYFQSSIEFARENFHNDHDSDIAPSDVGFSPAFTNTSVQTVKFSVQDVANGVQLKCEKLVGTSWVLQGSAIDPSPEPYMINKNLYLQSHSDDEYSQPSYAWIRTNGDAPEDVVFTHCTIRDLDLIVQVPGGGGGTNPGGGGGTNPDPDPDPGGGGGSSGGGTGGGGGGTGGSGGTDPPQIPASFKRTITFSRNLINNSLCVCSGVDPPTGTGGGTGGGGGGGGTGTPPTGYVTIFNVSPDNATSDKLVTYGDRQEMYRKYRQKFDKDNSVFIGKAIKIIKIFMAENNNPQGAVNVKIVSSTGVEIVNFGQIQCSEILNAGVWFTLQNLTNGYNCQLNDAIEFSYTGGDTSNYVKIFRKSSTPKTGSKIYRQNNEDDTFRSIDWDICMRVEVYVPP